MNELHCVTEFLLHRTCLDAMITRSMRGGTSASSVLTTSSFSIAGAPARLSFALTVVSLVNAALAAPAPIVRAAIADATAKDLMSICSPRYALLEPPARRDRHASVASEGTMCDLDAGRGLPALVFSEVNHTDNPGGEIAIYT